MATSLVFGGGDLKEVELMIDLLGMRWQLPNQEWEVVFDKGGNSFVDKSSERD